MNAWGQATAALHVPTGLGPEFVGLRLEHAYGLFDTVTFQFEGFSNPVSLVLHP